MSQSLRHSARVYRVFFKMARQVAGGRVLAAVAAGAVVGIFQAAAGLFTKLVVDALSAGAGGRALAASLAFLTLLVVSNLATDIASVVLDTDLGDRLAQAVEQRLMAVCAGAPGLDHLERPEFFDKIKAVRDGSFTPFLVLRDLPTSVAIVFSLAFSTALLGMVNPWLGLVPLVALPGAVIQFRSHRKHLSLRDQTAPEERLARHYLELATSPAAAKEVRIFGLGPLLLARHKRISDAYIATLTRDQFRRTWAGLAASGLYGIAMAGALAFAGWLALARRASLGDIALVVVVSRAAIAGIQGSGGIALRLAELAFVGERYLWLLDYRSRLAVPPPAEVAHPAPISQGIMIDAVSFGYEGRAQKALDDISLFIPAGSTVALVGENGAGKTSLVKLLMRFYDPDGGRILVDGVDLKQLDLDEWRGRSSAAFQDFVRFQLIAAEAVGVGDLESIEDSQIVMSAIEGAGGLDILERLPEGLENPLGRWADAGVELSEGQWQRVALARGMMRKSPGLRILDEPSAALDALAEHEIFETFAKLARPAEGPAPVTVLVSHRFSTVRMADLIVVMHQGRIEESGSHEDLMQAGGRYSRLFHMQASNYQGQVDM